jgi:hypothetical protein
VVPGTARDTHLVSKRALGWVPLGNTLCGDIEPIVVDFECVCRWLPVVPSGMDITCCHLAELESRA